MSTFLCGTNISIEWLSSALQQKKAIKTKLVSWQAERVGEGQGFDSDMIRVVLQWDDSSKPDLDLPTVVIAKSANLGGWVGKMSEVLGSEEVVKNILLGDEREVSMAHSLNECRAYDWLKRADVPLAKVFHAELSDQDHLGVLLMEDLTSRGHISDYIDGLSLDQLMHLATVFGRLHALSLRDTSWRGVVGTWGFPTKWPYEEHKRVNLTKNNPEHFALFNDPRIWRYFDDNLLERLKSDSLEALKNCTVLSHNDTWTNNIFIDRFEQHKILALIDWEAAGPGNCVRDLSWALACSTDPQIRRNHYKAVLERYFEILQENLPTNFELPFDFTDLLKAYDFLLPVNMVFATVVMIHAPNQAKTKDDQDKITIRALSLYEDVLNLDG